MAASHVLIIELVVIVGCRHRLGNRVRLLSKNIIRFSQAGESIGGIDWIFEEVASGELVLIMPIVDTALFHGLVLGFAQVHIVHAKALLLTGFACMNPGLLHVVPWNSGTMRWIGGR